MSEDKVIAGRLKLFFNNWIKMTNDNFILNTIKGYRIPLDRSSFQKGSSKLIKFSENEQKFLNFEITRLHRIGVIQKSSYNKEQVVSSYFLKCLSQMVAIDSF